MLGSSCSPCCGPTGCNGCTAELPTYLTVTFTQTAPITGGYHSALIDLSGTYSIPSCVQLAWLNESCRFSGAFSKTYKDAIYRPAPYPVPGYYDLIVDFVLQATIGPGGTSGYDLPGPWIVITLAGINLNAGDESNITEGLYQIRVGTGTPRTDLGNQQCYSLEPYRVEQQQSLTNCLPKTIAAQRLAFSTSPSDPYRVTYSLPAVQCGTFQWDRT